MKFNVYLSTPKIAHTHGKFPLFQCMTTIYIHQTEAGERKIYLICIVFWRLSDGKIPR